MNTTAAGFVDLVAQFEESVFPDEDAACLIMLALVRDAGFDVTKVTRGLLRGNYRDQDGSSTGETYAINSFPYKVMSGRENNERATIWLDLMFSRVLRIPGSTREELIDATYRAVWDSRPLPPIVLTDTGDALGEYPRENVLKKGTRDEDALPALHSTVGVHELCHGFVDHKAASKTHDALCCRACNLRIPFPKFVTTYGQLRQQFAQFNH